MGLSDGQILVVDLKPTIIQRINFQGELFAVLPIALTEMIIVGSDGEFYKYRNSIVEHTGVKVKGIRNVTIFQNQ
jgi:hypothetical protein